jgi:hypothetical protein
MLFRLSGSRAAILSTQSRRSRRHGSRRLTSNDTTNTAAASQDAPAKDSSSPFVISFPDNPFAGPPPNASYPPSEPAYQLRSPFDSTPFMPPVESTPFSSTPAQPAPVESSPTASGPAPVRRIPLQDAKNRLRSMLVFRGFGKPSFIFSMSSKGEKIFLLRI